MIHRLAYLVLVATVAATAPACGGGGDPGPGPLAHHLDEEYVALIPMEDKQPMLEAQDQFHRAKAERMKAEADYGEVGTKLDIAHNEQKQAALDESSASKLRESADSSNDQNRINAAMRDQHAAELKHRAADRKVEMLEARRSYLKKQLRYAEENMYALEAKYELAKAKLARDKGISPKGFTYAEFPRQAEDRSRRAQKAKLLADQEKQKAAAKRSAWLAADKQANAAAAPPAPATPAPATGP